MLTVLLTACTLYCVLTLAYGFARTTGQGKEKFFREQLEI
jgi:hypothetical protein